MMKITLTSIAYPVDSLHQKVATGIQPVEPHSAIMLNMLPFSAPSAC